jgi:tape measure domain-containing protein
MALLIGELFAKLGLQSKEFDQGLNRAKGGLADVTKQALGVAAGMAGFQGLQSAIEGTVGAGLKWNMMLETAGAKWETLLGSQQAAQQQLAWMADFAAKTPFEFEDLDRAAGRAKAFGFEIGYVNGTLLPALGNAAAATGTGSEGIDRLTVALGQMQAKTKVSAEEMMQLTEMGIPAWKLLAENMGMTIPQLMDLSSKGLIPAGKAIPALVAGMEKSFGGAMQRQAQTMTGKLSTMKDNAKQLLGDAFKPAFDYLSKTALPIGISMLDKMAQGMKDGGLKGAFLSLFDGATRDAIANIWEGIKVLGESLWTVGKDVAPAAKAALGGLIAVLGATFGWIADHGDVVKATLWGIVGAFMAYKTISTVIWAVGAAQKALTAATAAYEGVSKMAAVAQWALNAALNANPIGLVVVAIGLLIAAGYLIVKNWDTVKRVGLNAWGYLKIGIIGAIKGILKYMTWWLELIPGIGDKVKELQARLSSMIDEEKQAIDDRNAMAEGAAQAAQEAEEAKVLSAKAAAQKSTQAWEGAGQAEQQVYQDTAQAAGDATAQKVEYLDEFGKAWERNTEDAKTVFERAQEDATDKFKTEQEARLEAFKQAQERELTEFERGQEAQKTALERTLEDEATAFERAQEDKLDTFKRGLDAEKTAFEREQEDILDFFKETQRQELDAFKATQDAKRAELDSEYKAKLDAINASKDAIRDAKDAEDAARRQADLQEKIAKAQADVDAAQLNGDPGKIMAAKEKLADAQLALQDYLTEEARKAELKRLDDQAEALRQEWDQKKDALQNQQDAELQHFQDVQAARLEEEQRRLEAEKTAFEARLDQRKTQYERELEDEKTAFERAQENRKTQFEQELEDQKTAFTAQQEAALAHFQAMQDEEQKAWDRAQEDRKTRYEQELEDAKEHYAKMLDEQRAYVAQAQALGEQAKAAAQAAAAAGAQAATQAAAAASSAANSSQFGNNGQGTAAQVAANESRLASDASYVEAEKKRAQSVLDARKAAGMDTSQQEAYLKRLNESSKPQGGGNGMVNKMAEGGIHTTPTMVGDVRPEVTAPLSTLWGKLAGLARHSAQQAIGAAGGAIATAARAAVSAAGGQGGGGGTLNLQVVMDGRQVAKAALPYIPGQLLKVGVRP